MTNEEQDVHTLQVIAEGVLRQATGADVVLEAPQSLREKYRNRVQRFAVAQGPHILPASVIVKASVGEGEQAYKPDDDSHGSTAWRFTNEWAGNRFLNECPTPVPLNARLLGGNRSAGVFVLEDLGTGPALADRVQGDNPDAAEAAFFAYARALGQMHAQTAGQRAKWQTVRQAVGGTELERDGPGMGWQRRSVVAFEEACTQLGVALAAGFADEVEAVRQALDSPGPFDAFSPNDTCPDNHRLMPDGTVRFFDFEWAGYRHALLDAAYLRVPFPTCWCVNRLPDNLPDRLEAAYRAELVQGCAEASDDTVFYPAMSHACAYWMIETVQDSIRTDLEGDQNWGISSLRQRHLYRLETFIETTSRFGHLPALTETATALRATLAARWLPDLEPMPVYAAFRPHPVQG